MKKVMLWALLALMSSPAFSLAFVDVGIRGGVGLDFVSTTYLGDDVYRFYDITDRSGLVNPHVGIQTHLGFFDWLSLSIGLNMNFNRGETIQLSGDPFANINGEWTGWQPFQRATYDVAYHSFALDLAMNYHLKWWYVGGGLGVALNTPAKSFSSLKVFDKEIYDQFDGRIIHANDLKSFVSLNLMLESGVHIPIIDDLGFFTVGARVKFDVLARNKGIPTFDSNRIDYYDPADSDFFVTDFDATRNIGNKFLIDVFVGYTYRFHL